MKTFSIPSLAIKTLSSLPLLATMLTFLANVQPVHGEEEGMTPPTIVLQPIVPFTSADSAASTLVGYALTFGGLVCFGYIIYGGYKYITAGPSADNTAAARRTILNAIIGLIVLSLSFVIFTIATTIIGINK